MIAKQAESNTSQVRSLVLEGWGDRYIADRLGLEITDVIRIRGALTMRSKPARSEPKQKRRASRDSVSERPYPISVVDTGHNEAELGVDVVAYVWPGSEVDPLPATPFKLLASRLTEREREVLALVLNGLANGQIAARIATTESTVRAHMKNMREKLGVVRNEQLFLALSGSGGITFEAAEAGRGRPCRAR